MPTADFLNAAKSADERAAAGSRAIASATARHVSSLCEVLLFRAPASAAAVPSAPATPFGRKQRFLSAIFETAGHVPLPKALLGTIYTCCMSFYNYIRAQALDYIPTGWYVPLMNGRKKEKSGATARQKLLDAALSLIRAKGYEATTVDDLCGAAGVTKGAFFHHFASKEALAVAAAEYWSETTGAFFAAAPYHRHTDPLQRVLGYIDFRKAILTGKLPEFTCLVGTMVQEVYNIFAADPRRLQRQHQRPRRNARARHCRGDRALSRPSQHHRAQPRAA